ncbi:MAG: phosphodiester glycosidase family protein [Nitrospirae bacterium]|nr:MAG: phosphodiester glycosidase family protein [Nitrospirota bacterium]
MRSCINLARENMSSARGQATIVCRVLFLAGACLLSHDSLAAQEVSWTTLVEGLAVTVWEPGTRCKEASPLLLVKVDPERFRFSTYHFLDEGLSAPVTIQEWQLLTNASLLFNAGLFREDYSYLGLLFKEGRPLGTKRHPRWQGLFVAEPVNPGVRKAHVLDLAFERFREDQPPYREAAQSLMLLDRTGKPRVRQTGKRAHQTVVAEDEEGHILLIKTSDIVTLRGLADCLRVGFPSIRQAMAMDGGSSSDLLIGTELLKPLRNGPEPFQWYSLLDGSGTGHITLPAVIGIQPRTGNRHPSP